MPKIAVILTPNFADWEYAFIGGTGGPFYGLEIQYFSPQPGEIQSQGGLTIKVPNDLEDLVSWKPDGVVVIGGMIWETDQAPDISDFLKAQHNQGTVVAGICGGTLALGRAGLLNKVRHTSNDTDFLSKISVGYEGSALYANSPSAVSAEGVITAPGKAPVSFTAAVFKAVGLDQEKVGQFRAMMAAEHA